MIDPGTAIPSILQNSLQNSQTPPKQEVPDILAGLRSIADRGQSYVVVAQENAKSRGDITQGKFVVFLRQNGESATIGITEHFKNASVFNQDKNFIKELMKLSFPGKSFTFLNIEKND